MNLGDEGDGVHWLMVSIYPLGKRRARTAPGVLRQESEGEDHIDAVIAVSRAIDVYLLEYAMTRSSFESLTKAYRQARE